MKTSRLRRCAAALFLSVLCAPAAGQESLVRGPDRRLGSAGAESAPGVAEYRRKWAVIIGINYTERDDARREGLSPLTNAEADAQAVADVLIRDYAFAAENIRLLLGKHATRAAIVQSFGKQLLRDPSQVQSEDCVLVFFAGHGNRETANEQTHAYLCPHDVVAIDKQGLDDQSCVKIRDLVEYLEQCPARHKLMILDSCHSGEVFQFAGSQRSIPVHSVDRELFQHSVVQAMAAARGFQKADDAVGADVGTGLNGTHSPFTTALLESLEGGVKSPAFGASALFAHIPHRVKELGSPAHPRFGTIRGDGEFYFFRQTPVPVETTAVDVTLQTLPGLSGKWWFDESPWLLPSLRSDVALLEALPKTVTTLRLGGDGEATAMVRSGGLYEPRVGEVYELLRQRTRERVRTWPVARQQAYLKLSDLTGGEVSESERTQLLDAVDVLGDPHLRAVVHHRFNQPDAESLYLAALEFYQQAGGGDASVRRQGLECLCQADYARFLYDSERFQEARSNFEQARSLSAGSEQSPLFFVHCLIQESAALARLGEWFEADARLDQARRIAQARLAPEHALVAAVCDQAGWNAMDRWLVDEAGRHFQAAIELRERNAANDLQTRLAVYHNRHGLAMTHRFRTDYDQARQEYRQLAADLWEEATRSASRHARELVSSRLVNTLERLGDACLFAVPCEPLEAQAAYADSIEHCRELPPHQLYRMRAKLRGKHAAALALLGEPTDALVRLREVELEDWPQLTPEQQSSLAFYTQIASGLAEQAAGNTQAFRDLLGAALRTAESRRQTLARQELELLLFAGRLLLTEESVPPVAEDAKRLMSLVPQELIQRAILPYLRPYHDASLDVRLAAAKTFQLLEFLQTFDEVKAARRLTRFPSDQTVVAFYLRTTDGYALIRPAGGAKSVSRLIPLAFGRETLTSAQLPEELAAVLQAESRTLIHWCDYGSVPVLTNAEYPFRLQPGHALMSE